MVRGVCGTLLCAVPLALWGCATSAEMRPEIGTGWCSETPTLTLPSNAGEEVTSAQITWIASDHEGAREASAAWCDVVGPPVVIPQSHPAFKETAPPERLIAGTWNIWVGAADVQRFLEEELQLECTGGAPVLRAGFQHFFLMLQEAHHRSPLIPDAEKGAPVPWGIHPEGEIHDELDIVDVAQACGLSMAYIPSARNGWEGVDGLGEDKGNAILSTLPLHRVTGIDLPFEGGRKVAVAATVFIPTSGEETRLDLTTVHLDVASTLVRTLITGNQTRARQAIGMLDGLEVGGFSGHAGVVGGDFNTWVSRDASLKAVKAEYPDSPPISGIATRGPFPADHLFFREGPGAGLTLAPGSYQVIQETYGSDHRARLIFLDVARR